MNASSNVSDCQHRWVSGKNSAKNGQLSYWMPPNPFASEKAKPVNSNNDAFAFSLESIA